MKPRYGLLCIMPLDNLCILFPSSFCVLTSSRFVSAIELSASVIGFAESLTESALNAVLVASSSGRMLFNANLLETNVHSS